MTRMKSAYTKWTLVTPPDPACLPQVAPAVPVNLPAGQASGGPTAAPGTAGASPSPESPTILWTQASCLRALDGKHFIAPNR